MPPTLPPSPSTLSRIYQRGRVTCVVRTRTRTRRSVLSHGLTVLCHAHHAGPPPSPAASPRLHILRPRGRSSYRPGRPCGVRSADDDHGHLAQSKSPSSEGPSARRVCFPPSAHRSAKNNNRPLVLYLPAAHTPARPDARMTGRPRLMPSLCTFRLQSIFSFRGLRILLLSFLYCFYQIFVLVFVLHFTGGYF